MKKIIFTLSLMVFAFVLVGCGDKTGDKTKPIQYDAEAIASFVSMKTPGDDADGKASLVTLDDEKIARIETNGVDDWGGVETPTINVDVKKTSTLTVDIVNVSNLADSTSNACLWGIKLVVDGDLDIAPWGHYVFADSNNTGIQRVDLNDVLNGEDDTFSTAYGEGLVKMRFWIFPAKGTNCSVDIKSFVIDK